MGRWKCYMNAVEEIRIERTKTGKPKPDQEQLGYGKYFTDHMFLMDYTEEGGWHAPRIVPYEPLAMDPATMVFHYGQAIFEGMKAFRTTDGRALLFRPDRNARRLNLSAVRLNIPPVEEKLFVEAVRTLIRVDADWIPDKRGASLYIRPFIIATEVGLGVRPSSRYLFMIILSPVDSYYPGGMKPVRIQVENEYVRAVRGGTGFAKASGNYAGSLKAQALAKEQGCDQVLWLDALEHKYIEEVGSMNVFFKINGEVVTPALGGSILDGVTRASAIELLRGWGLTVVERKLGIDELWEASSKGQLEEAFGTGTAVVISPIGSLHYGDEQIEIGRGEIGEWTARLYDTLTGIQTGRIEDKRGWMVVCE